MDTNKLIKQRAKNNLRGQWGINIGINVLAYLIVFAITFAFQSIMGLDQSEWKQAVVSFMLSVFLFFAFSYATSYVGLLVARGQRAEVENLFVVFDKRYYFPDMIISLLENVVTQVVSFLLFLPVLFVSGVSVYFSYVLTGGQNHTAQVISEGNFSLGLLLGGLLMMFLLIILQFVISGIFQFAVLTKFDFPDLAVGQCLSVGWKLLLPNLGRFFLLYLSFIGWGLLSTVTCFIGLLWLIPYANTCVAAFYDSARAEYAEIHNSEPQ